MDSLFCFIVILWYYKRYKDFISNSRTAYEKAWKYGWLKEYTWLTKGGDKKEDIRTLDDCIKIAKQYKTYAEFMKNESLIYSYCKYKKWNKQIIWGKWFKAILCHLIAINTIDG